MSPTRRSKKGNEKEKVNETNKKTTITTRSSKRKHNSSPNSNIDESNISKKNKINILSNNEMEELKLLISSSSDKIEKKIDTLAANVKSEVDALKSTVVEFHTTVSEELKIVKNQLSHQSERIDNNDDDFQRAQRNYDLRVTGFEAKDNENLYEIFKQIAAAIGFVIGPNTVMPEIERVLQYDRKTKTSTPSKTMLVHFAILRQKQQFYSLYLSKMPLDPAQFGLESTNRITIGENLTKKNAQIFKQVLLKKRDGKIAQAHTEDGIVKIKITKGKSEPTHIIRNVQSLETIVMEHQLAQAKDSTINTEAHPINNNKKQGEIVNSTSERDSVAPKDNNNSNDNNTGSPMQTST